MKIKRVVIALVVLVLLAGGWWSYRLIFGKPHNINHFYERIFVELLLQDPELLTQLGFVDNTWLDFHSDDLTDASPAHTEKLNRMIVDDLSLLLEYDYESQDDSQKLSTDILRWYLEDEQRGIRFTYHGYPVNQLYGVQRDLPEFMNAYHQVVDKKSAKNYVKRLSKFPDKIGQVLEGLRLREERDIVPPKFVVGKALEETRTFASTPVEENILFTSFESKLDTLTNIDEDKKATLLSEVKKAIEEWVVPSYLELAGYLEALEAKVSTDDGIWKLPDGDAYYAYLIGHHTTTDFTPQEVHDVGLSEVARIQSELRDILNGLGYRDKTVAEHLQDLAQEKRFLYPDSDSARAEVLRDFQAIIDDIDGNLSHIFSLRPESGVKVERVPRYTEATATGAYYSPPAMDGSRPGVFYVNLRDLDEHPKFGMRTLAYHEAIPGHHFQIALQQKITGGPTFRKVIPFTAYVEGWALYAERLAAEYGFHEDPYSNLGRLQAELFRSVRLVVDTGIHYKRWTREQAIEYMIANTGVAENGVVSEVERYIVMPGQACAYKIGMMKILELRKTAQRELGVRFDIREFHAAVLENGAAPLAILEQIVKEYIEDEKSR